MITSSLTGNLGNHMWIYAITRAVAEHNNYEWGFNPSPEFDYLNGYPQMSFMDIDYGVQHSYSYAETPPWIKHEHHEKYEHIETSNDSYDYHPYQPEIFNIKDNTKLYIRCCQDKRYLSDIKEKVKQWFKIKEEKTKIYKSILDKLTINLDENLTILNVRGGEYKPIKNLILPETYWQNAMKIMRERNSKTKFLCVTDDVTYANNLLYHKIPVIHESIGFDYYLINNAKNLILSNSSFAIFPAWLDNNNPYVIAPFGWARYNTTDGYWANSDMWTFPWHFLDREGVLD
jgi:hypothetical protein